MMQQEKLENCPFCDVKPDVIDGMDNGTQTPRLGCGTILCDNDVCGVNPSVDYYNGLAQGAYVWNTRADSERVTVVMPPVTDSEKVKALKEGLRMQREDCAILNHINVGLRKEIKDLVHDVEKHMDINVR